MINSTLGGLIKDYRLQKGISQQDIAFALGWKETSRLSRIEQGRTERPPRELLDKIITSIGLEEEEKNTLLLTGGYLPTEEEILRIKKEIDPILNKWQYPAVLIDFTWRIISANIKAAEIFEVSLDFVREIHKSNLRVFDLRFNESLSKDRREDQETAENFLKKVIAEFKYEQRYRTKEKWYIDHVKKLMDNDLFRKLWIEVNARDRINDVLGKYTKKQFPHPKDKIKLLKYYMFEVPVLKDPRFEVELYVPVDIDTFSIYQ